MNRGGSPDGTYHYLAVPGSSRTPESPGRVVLWVANDEDDNYLLDLTSGQLVGGNGHEHSRFLKTVVADLFRRRVILEGHLSLERDSEDGTMEVKSGTFPATMHFAPVLGAERRGRRGSAGLRTTSRSPSPSAEARREGAAGSSRSP